MSEKTTVRLIAMGGTIAARDSSEGALHALGGDALVERVASAGIDVDATDLATGSSIAFGESEVRALGREVQASMEGGARGVVVTHGTDTLEESAYLLALTVPRRLGPIVLTGAMRHDGSPGADGPANLRDAILVAADSRAAGLGPVVLLDGRIHAARFVSKTSTTSVGGFSSPTAGPVGALVEGRVSLWFRPSYEDFVGELPDGPLPRVELVGMVLGASGEQLTAMVDSAPAGIVIDGFGGGHVAPSLLESVDRASRRGIPVVVSSRVGDGPTNQTTYAAPGCELDLMERGASMAGFASGLKARLRLAVALAHGLSASDVFPVE